MQTAKTMLRPIALIKESNFYKNITMYVFNPLNIYLLTPVF